MKKLSAFILLAAFIMIMASILSGCSTFNKQKSSAEKFYRTYPNELAPICASAFPVKEVLIPGKIIIKHDTTIEAGPQLKCPPDAAGKIVYVKCPPTKNITNTVYKTDTIYRENTARADQYRQELLTCGSTTEAQEKQIAQLKSTASKKTWWIVGLAAGLAASIGLRFITFKLPSLL